MLFYLQCLPQKATKEIKPNHLLLTSRPPKQPAAADAAHRRPVRQHRRDKQLRPIREVPLPPIPQRPGQPAGRRHHPLRHPAQPQGPVRQTQEEEGGEEQEADAGDQQEDIVEEGDELQEGDEQRPAELERKECDQEKWGEWREKGGFRGPA